MEEDTQNDALLWPPDEGVHGGMNKDSTPEDRLRALADQPEPEDLEYQMMRTLLAVPHALRAIRTAYGDDFLRGIAAETHAETATYHYFGFGSQEAAAAANAVLERRSEQLRSEGLKKPNCLMVAGLSLEADTRWLTLSVGRLQCDAKRMLMRDGPDKLMLFYAFDTVAEIAEAAERVFGCDEYKKVHPGLFQLSRPEGKDLEVVRLGSPRYWWLR